MSAKQPIPKQIAPITIEEYLNGERLADSKHELVAGQVFAMADASKNHQRISTNLNRHLANHLENSPCEPFASDMKVKADCNFFYPDIVVACEDDVNEYFISTPLVIIEVLSKSTRRRDKSTKLISYLNIPSLQEYVMIEQDWVEIEVLRRKDHWRSSHYFLGDKVTFESIDLTMPVVAVYDRVNNEDINSFLQQDANEN